MATLHLYATEAALELALEGALAGGPLVAVELGRGLTSIPRLLADAGADGGGVGTIGELLLVLASRAPGDPPGTAAGERDVLGALRRSEVTPAALEAVAPRLVGPARDEVRRWAARLRRYERLLGDRVDPGGAVAAALARIRRGAVSSLAEVDAVHVHAPLLDPLARALVEALLGRGVAVRCDAVDAPADATTGVGAIHADATAGAAAAALEALEAIGADGLERVRVELGPGPRPEIACAGSPRLEARDVARRVRDRIAAGTAPDEIVVVADDRLRRAELADALRRYEVPVEVAREASALDAEAVRLVPILYQLADAGVPRDRLVDVLASRYVAGGPRLDGRRVSAGRVARAVREEVPAGARADDYAGALRRWADAGGERAVERTAIARHVVGIVDALATLPASATIAEHVSALRRLLARLELATRARTLRRGTPPAPESRPARALMRDQAAIRALEAVLDALPRAAARAGLDGRSFARRALVDVLTAVLDATPLPPGGGRGASVQVTSSADLMPRPTALLVLAAAEEGALPARREDDPLLPDDVRRPLERALGRAPFGRAAREEQRACLAIAQARAAARAVILSWSRADADGQPRLHGAIVAHARAAGATEVRSPLAPVPRLDEARTFDELAARLGVELAGDLAAREGLSTATLAALRARLDGPRLARVERLAAIERTRAAFFAGERAAGDHDGHVADPVALATLRPRLPGSVARPLSPSTIGRYAECPQRFFLEAVLRLRPLEALGDDLDERAAGALAHAALEALFTAWRDAGRFPLRGSDEERAAIAPAIARAVAAFAADEALGDPAVFASRLRRLERTLEALWRREVEAQAATALRPTELELSFAGLTVDDGDDPIHLTGTIDRLDTAGDAAAVYDYKSARLRDLAADLRPEAFGETSWQLPLYAAAMRARGARDVSIHYYSLRDVAVRGLRAPPSLVLDRGTADAPTLGDRVRELARRFRGGGFEVTPREGACLRCQLQAACRVDLRDSDEEEGAR